MKQAHCKALFITAPASGQGKTTITAALARLFHRQGKTVRVFKTGPDYLDPQILKQASGHPVQQLDLWMAGTDYCQHQLYKGAREADLILVEGVMGMFDGTPSSADLAAQFGIPMALVIDVSGMAQTAGAVAVGLANFRDDIVVAGLLANNCSTERHRQLIEEALPESLPLLANLKNAPEVALPERHLGLVQAEEVADELEQHLNAGADWLEEAGIARHFENLPDVTFTDAVQSTIAPRLQGVRIAIARDRAFSFIYDANLELLQDMGAELRFFSPLNDQQLPEADALWLPGGYPELNAAQLADNHSINNQIREFFLADKPILAECGGFLYTLQSLTDLDEQEHTMLGLLQGHGAMRGTRGCQGMQTAMLPEGDVRAHAHHRSLSHATPPAISHGKRQRHPAPGEAIYRERRLTASYLHLFFPSNPDAIADLFAPSQN